ncbi:MAG: hypothetical protein NXI32_27715 [bacterium]|nr:hypothetical protein [bacterium]
MSNRETLESRGALRDAQPLRMDGQRPPHAWGRGLMASWMAVVAVVAFLCWSDSLAAQETLALLPERDCFWELSTRDFPTRLVEDPIQHMACRCVRQGRWDPCSADDLLSASPVTWNQRLPKTIVYVHGNWTPEDEARKRGWLYYLKLKRLSDEPIQFVIFSWDSDRKHGIARDLRSKQSQLNRESYYLAHLLRQLAVNRSVGLIGFSFGGAVISGGLHLYAGGSLPEIPKLADSHAEDCSSVARVSLLAPAFDCEALGSCGKYSMALAPVDRLVNLYNPTDPVLKRFGWLDVQHTPEAAGFCGLLNFRFPADEAGTKLAPHPKILQLDCRTQIGKTHAEMAYLQECSNLELAMRNVLAH